MIEKYILLSFLLIGTFVPAFAQIQSNQSNIEVQTLPISVTTDKPSYADGDRMTISGSVTGLIGDLPVTIEIRDPSGNIVMITQVHPNPDKTFSVQINTGGSLWVSAGTYSLMAQYGSTSRNEIVNFQFSGFAPPILVGGTNISISYKIVNGQMTNVTADTHTKALIIWIKSTANGNVTLTLPRTLIDAKMGGQDSSFVVTNHGSPVVFQEYKSDSARTLTIPFHGPGDDRLMITGTQVIPEFGQVVSVILVTAIILGFLVVKSSKLGFEKSV